MSMSREVAEELEALIVEQGKVLDRLWSLRTLTKVEPPPPLHSSDPDYEGGPPPTTTSSPTHDQLLDTALQFTEVAKAPAKVSGHAYVGALESALDVGRLLAEQVLAFSRASSGVDDIPPVHDHVRGPTHGDVGVVLPPGWDLVHLDGQLRYLAERAVKAWESFKRTFPLETAGTPMRSLGMALDGLSMATPGADPAHDRLIRPAECVQSGGHRFSHGPCQRCGTDVLYPPESLIRHPFYGLDTCLRCKQGPDAECHDPMNGEATGAPEWKMPTDQQSFDDMAQRSYAYDAVFHARVHQAIGMAYWKAKPGPDPAVDRVMHLAALYGVFSAAVPLQSAWVEDPPKEAKMFMVGDVDQQIRANLQDVFNTNDVALIPPDRGPNPPPDPPAAFAGQPSPLFTLNNPMDTPHTYRAAPAGSLFCLYCGGRSDDPRHR